MNIKEREKTSSIVKDWKIFLKEEKEEKIKTIGDLKIALAKKQSFETLKETLVDLGIDLVPYGSTVKTLFGFFKSVSNIPDSKRKIAGPLASLDLDDDFNRFVKEEVINGVLKDIIDDTDDSMPLSKINLNKELVDTIEEKLKNNKIQIKLSERAK